MLINCRCGAKHNPNVRWLLGRYDDGTANIFTAHSRLQPGHCPICRRPPIDIFRDKVNSDYRLTM